jgi:hypothetical protein
MSVPRETVAAGGHDGPVTAAAPHESGAPIYRYDLLLCPDFNAVLEGEGSPIDASAAIEEALESGRILLQARGGAGKSVTLLRIADAARARELRVVRVWAVDWTNQAASAGGPVDPAALLAALSAAAEPRTSQLVFADDDESLLLIDGLNEVQNPYVQQILATVDLLAARYTQLGVIVADRLARRAVDPLSWRLATLTPVPNWQVREILGPAYEEDKASLFANPFFLERARVDPLSAATHRAFFTAQVGVEDASLRQLASAVNRAYHQHKDRLIDVGWLQGAVGKAAVDQLVEAGVLQSAGQRSRFGHHLISDFLAALALADNPEQWNRVEFDALTFKASSFDALAMLLDEIDPASADLLVRRVHDWNLYAAAYLIAEDDARGRRVSANMKAALLAMLAERRFDRIQSTAQQVTDALRLQKSPIAKTLLDARTLDEVIRIVATVKVEESWFGEWKQLFQRVDGDARSDDLSLLQQEDGVLGWTAANVLKRLHFGRDSVADVLALLASESATVRWRAAHVLGAVPTEDVAEALLDRMRTDDDLWVRYGALRSLIEVATRSATDMRQRIFIELGSVADSIVDTPQLAREVERALHVTVPPHGWSEDAGLLLEQLWANGRSVAEQDRWRELSASLRLEEPALS